MLQGSVTLQLTRDPAYARGFLSARSVTGFLSDVYTKAADEVGKIFLVADETVSTKKYTVLLTCPVKNQEMLIIMSVSGPSCCF